MNCDMQVKTERTSLGTRQWQRKSNWRKEHEAKSNKKQEGNNLRL